MSPTFIAGVSQHLPNARIAFDKFTVIGHASTAVKQMRRIEQRTEKSLKGMRWTLLKDTAKLNQTRGRSRYGCFDCQDNRQAYRSGLGLQRATARDF